MSETAKLVIGEDSYEFPVITGSQNEKAIDISRLRSETGYITLDIGYKNTGSTKSAITYLDGENGILHYRGYPIEQLAEQSEFLEVAYLLIYGELPTQEAYASFKDNITHHTLVHEDMKASFSKYPKNWGLKRADKNIDHRRVPNLQRYFKRVGAELPISDKVDDYKVGDLVAWDLNNKSLWHIGVVVGEGQFVHNIGGGPVLETGIKSWKIVGHYRFKPKGWEPVAVKRAE